MNGKAIVEFLEVVVTDDEPNPTWTEWVEEIPIGMVASSIREYKNLNDRVIQNPDCPIVSILFHARLVKVEENINYSE